MAGDEQQAFKDFEDLEQFIEDLQAGQAPPLPENLAPEQQGLYQSALLFHSAVDEESTPRPEFAANLQSRLSEQLARQERHRRKPARSTQVSRRMLLTGGAVAAASVAVGAGIDHIIEQSAPSAEIQVSGPPTSWFFVTTIDKLGNQALRFRSAGLVGYLVRDSDANDDSPEEDRLIAMSAACTHRGCIVQWSGNDRKFHCPCHNGIFNEDGGPNPASPIRYLEPLARLDVKLDGKNIYVRMPE